MPVASLNPSDRLRGRLRTALAALVGLATLATVMLADLNNDVAARPAPGEIGVAAPAQLPGPGPGASTTTSASAYPGRLRSARTLTAQTLAGMCTSPRSPDISTLAEPVHEERFSHL